MNLSIKDVPEHLAARLRERASRNHRSLQGELMAIVCAAVQDDVPAPASTARPVANHSAAGLPGGAASVIQGWKTVEQLQAERRASGWTPPANAAQLPLGVDIVRADRDSP